MKKALRTILAANTASLIYLNHAHALTTMFGGSCSSYDCWIDKVWGWGLTIAVPLATLMVAAGGVIWATAGDTTERVELGKKMITSALSGLAVLILAKLLFVVLGLS